MFELILPFVVLFCLIFVISRTLSKRNNQNDDFDERQMILRGISYRYGFLTMSTLNILFGIILIYDEKYAGYGIGFLTISFVAGVLVYAIYNVWHDSFLTMHQNRRSYMVLLAAISLIQFVNYFGNSDWRNIGAVMSGIAIVQLGCAILFLMILVTIILKSLVQGREEE